MCYPVKWSSHWIKWQYDMIPWANILAIDIQSCPSSKTPRCPISPNNNPRGLGLSIPTSSAHRLPPFTHFHSQGQDLYILQSRDRFLSHDINRDLAMAKAKKNRPYILRFGWNKYIKSRHTWYLSFFLHGQTFWRIKFTHKKRVNYDKIHSKLPIFCVITENTQ